MCGCFVGWRFAYPTWDSRNLSLIYSPVLLKLPVLEPGGTGGGGDWPPPVRSLRHE